MLTANDVSSSLVRELEKVSDPTLLARLRELLVAPYPVQRDWDYGPVGQKFTCWTVLEHQPSNTGIAYCSEGFGPTAPWGIVSLSGDQMRIGMDSAWFPTLESAMRESMAFDGTNPEGYEVP